MDDAPPEVLFPSFYLCSMCLNPPLHSIVGMTLLDQQLGTAHKLSILLNVGLHISRKEDTQNISTTQLEAKECLVQI